MVRLPNIAYSAAELCCWIKYKSDNDLDQAILRQEPGTSFQESDPWGHENLALRQ